MTDAIPRRILVPLDGSALAARSVGYGAMLAGRLGARLIMFTVLTGDSRDALESFAAGEGISLEEAVNSYLGRLAHAVADGVDAEICSRAGANAAASILEFVEDEQIDMIVMASHGRSGITRWLLGSVADKVVQSSPVPVLVIPMRGAD